MEKELRKFLDIPDRILVGYKKDPNDSSKLGFVTHYKKSKIAKEASWNLWRDKKINPDEFENKPLKGFKIDCDDFRYYGIGWTKRGPYFCCVRDPRGFDFDISFQNLLEILKVSNCTEGGEIEEELLYSWEEADLILLSTKSPDYAATKLMTKTREEAGITWSTLVPGLKYEMKESPYESEIFYIGQLGWKFTVGWDNKISTCRYHTFYNIKYKTIFPMTDIKQILYPAPENKKLKDEELNDIIRKFSELPCGRPNDKIERYVLKSVPELEEKKKRILIDRKFNTSINYWENRITVAKLSDSGREMFVTTWQLQVDGALAMVWNIKISIEADETINHSNLPCPINITEKDIEEAIKDTIPISDDKTGAVMVEIGGSQYVAENYGMYTPYPYNKSEIHIE